MSYVKISEAVGKGHPDKVADAISDTVLDLYLSRDPDAHVAVETLVTKQSVILAGEIASKAPVSNAEIAEEVRNTVSQLGYNSPELGFDSATLDLNLDRLTSQSPNLLNLNSGKAVAGDQGIMTGYASAESFYLMPIQHEIAQKAATWLSDLEDPRFHTDCKTVAVVYFPDDKDSLPTLVKLDASIHHSEGVTQADLDDLAVRLRNYLIHTFDGYYCNVDEDCPVSINPAGPFVFGGPAADTGLTGRKIVCDQYGGEVPVGGGAFSGKDPTKVDRSAALYARYIAAALVNAELADKALIQVSYMIGQEGPIATTLNTFGTNKTTLPDQELLEILASKNAFDFSVENIIKELDLKTPFYQKASYAPFYNVELPWQQPYGMAHLFKSVVANYIK